MPAIPQGVPQVPTSTQLPLVNPEQFAAAGYRSASRAVGLPKLVQPLGVGSDGTAQPYTPPPAASDYMNQIRQMGQTALNNAASVLSNEAKFGAASGSGGIVAGYAPEVMSSALNAPSAVMRNTEDAGLGMERNAVMGQEATNAGVSQANADRARLAQAQYGAYGNALRAGAGELGNQLRANSAIQGDRLRAYASVMNAGNSAALMAALNPGFNAPAYATARQALMPSFLGGFSAPGGLPGSAAVPTTKAAG